MLNLGMKMCKIRMGLLWLLSVAVVCHTTHMTRAWPGGSKGALKLSDNLLRNGTNVTAIKTNTTYEVFQNKSLENSNSTTQNATGNKKATANVHKLLEKREIPKFRISSLLGKDEEEPKEDKRAKFSSWGGKRSEYDINNELLENIKRAKFSSWGGKRDMSGQDEPKGNWGEARGVDNMNENKRAKFNSWAGKRNEESLDEKRAKFSSWAGKRGKFNSWAGKRSDIEPASEALFIPVSSWSHHTENMDQNSYYGNEDKRAKFSSWAGKRAPDYLGTSWNNIPSDNHIKYYPGGMGEPGNENIVKLWQDLMSRKRARFSSWAGKRSEEVAPDAETMVKYLDSEPVEKREKFSPWAGKKEEQPEKRKFSSWGGKRSINGTYGDSLEEKEEYPSMIVKRSVFSWNSPSLAYKRKPVFSSWGGKRSADTHTIQIRSLPIQRVLINGGKNWGTLMRPIRRGPEFYAWGGKRST